MYVDPALADRIVREHGLDAHGRLTLDLGTRRVTVTLDPWLRPVLADADGGRMRRLPPGSPAGATAALRALRDATRTAAARWLPAFEVAMTSGETWPAAQFGAHIQRQPVVRAIARALIWRMADGGPEFRIREDGTLADRDDADLMLPDDARVALFHNAVPGADAAVWTDWFGDFEIGQPIPQIERACFRLTAQQAAAASLPLVAGDRTDDRLLIILTTRGWRFLAHGGIARDWSDHLRTEIVLTPGWTGRSGPRALGDISIIGTQGAPAVFGDLGPIAASELLRDADWLSLPER